MNTKRILASTAAIGIMVTLSACAEEAAEPIVEDSDCVDGIEISGAWLSSPAIPGDPAAVYFNIANTGEANRMIRGADVEGSSSAMLHQTSEWNLEPSMDELLQLDVPAGESIDFNPETYHVMAMQTAEDMEVGGTSEVTLTFIGGDKCSFPAEIRAPGDAPAGEEEAEEG